MFQTLVINHYKTQFIHVIIQILMPKLTYRVNGFSTSKINTLLKQSFNSH